MSVPTRVSRRGFATAYATQKRTPKLSAQFYKEVISRNSVA